ncbi:MAG: glycosyltransferase family 4 protein [Verrucomicrobiae bacterium]|nr:glycosyltransferase family 4 protein [Verrucomicrobiae bacterium]
MRCRILINGRFLGQPIAGVQRYGREMIAALGRRSDPRFDFVLALQPSVDAPVPEGVSAMRGGHLLPRILWEQLWLPGAFGRAGCDILWSPCNIGPVRVTRQVLTIHDASPVAHGEWFSPHFRWSYRWVWRRLGHRVMRIVTDSAFSRDELTRHGVVTSDRIRVVPGGVSPAFRPISVRERGRGYVLALASRDPRKNIGRLLEAWAMMPSEIRGGRELIVAGGSYGCFASEGLRVPTGHDVRFLGYVADEDLPALYSGADAFVFPSLYEGFGLPPLEAMACGCPVIVSEVGPLPEVCGRAAAYIDPVDAGSIADGITRVMGDAKLRESLVGEGHRRASRFTWERAAEALLQVFEECWVEARAGH